jgi:hypothetical protein
LRRGDPEQVSKTERSIIMDKVVDAAYQMFKAGWRSVISRELVRVV